MKAVATVGKEPAVKALPERTTMAQDAYGRNTPRWLPAVEGRPEGPLSIVLGVPKLKGAEYLTREEALTLADQLMNAVERYDQELASGK